MAKSRRGVLLSNDDQAPSRRVAFRRRPSPVASRGFPTATKSRRGVLLSNDDQAPSRRVASRRRGTGVNSREFRDAPRVALTESAAQRSRAVGSRPSDKTNPQAEG